ncbi:MAG TPA: DUF4157 domain-containing protein [Kofleriaceae bacterium]|nr:DUF4157 domain-containing protein [Kofleriaceae bacterium]
MTSARERFDGTSGGGTGVQRRDSEGVGKHTFVQDLENGPRGGGVGKQSMVEQVQRKLAGAIGGDAAESPPSVAAAASHGVSGAGGPLPHADAIQRAFGRHDISGIAAHTDATAAAGAQAMGAQAFATGHHVAFAGAPDLHTAAHEAAHVVQQRAGISLKGGVGAEGDAYEQHADAVADRVGAGGSAEALLDRFAPGGATGAAAVQRKLGASQASGIRVREISTGRTGVISGKLVWGKHYPVQWDDGKSSSVDANDDNYEVVGSTTPASTTPASTTPAPSSSTPATGGKQPDRDISHFDDKDFQEQWAAKQDEVYAAVQAFIPRFQALDPAAEVRVRGSIATGVKANPNKVDPVSGERLLFNPTDFDIDAYIASDKLYSQAVSASGSSDAVVRGKIPGSKLPAVNAIIRDMRVALAKIAGNRDAPRSLQYRFNVIIRSVRNDKFTMQQDQRDMGAPLTIEPPESD